LNRRLNLALIATAISIAAPIALHAQQAATPAPAAAPAIAAGTTETSGVKFDNEMVTSRGSKLLLNGAGTRYKFVVKVYAAGLYLPARVNTVDGVLDLKTPRVFKVVMLRDIDANELGRLFTDGMQKNASREEFGRAIPGTIRLGELFAEKKKLEKGESFLIEWVPGTGTFITINGKLAVEPIKEPEFFSALMKIWFGKSPADANLKEALLGGNRSGG
jgi:Chalcone isomerase-like